MVMEMRETTISREQPSQNRGQHTQNRQQHTQKNESNFIACKSTVPDAMEQGGDGARQHLRCFGLITMVPRRQWQQSNRTNPTDIICDVNLALL